MTPAPFLTLDPPLLCLLCLLCLQRLLRRQLVQRLLRQPCLPLAPSVTPTRRHPSLAGSPDSLSRSEV